MYSVFIIGFMVLVFKGATVEFLDNRTAAETMARQLP
jgi:hypothetical protein